MTPDTEALARALEGQIAACEALIALAERERESLLAGRAAELPGLVAEQATWTGRLEAGNAALEDLLGAGADGDAWDRHVTTLGAEGAREALALRAALAERMVRLTALSRANGLLLGCEQALARRVAAALDEGSGAGEYGPRGAPLTPSTLIRRA